METHIKCPECASGWAPLSELIESSDPSEGEQPFSAQCVELLRAVLAGIHLRDCSVNHVEISTERFSCATLLYLESVVSVMPHGCARERTGGWPPAPK